MIRLRLHTARPFSLDEHVADYPGYEDVWLDRERPRGDKWLVVPRVEFPQSRGAGSPLLYATVSEGHWTAIVEFGRCVHIHCEGIAPVVWAEVCGDAFIYRRIVSPRCAA